MVYRHSPQHGTKARDEAGAQGVGGLFRGTSRKAFVFSSTSLKCNKNYNLVVNNLVVNNLVGFLTT